MPGSSRLARLLRLSCAFQLAVASAWFAWRWPVFPLQASLGALAVPLVAPLVLGIELVIVRWLAPGDPGVPVPRASQLLAAWRRETAQWFRVFWWRQPVRWRAPPDCLEGTGATPVVFVHGFMCNRGFWAPWLKKLQALGHPCVAVNLEPVFTSIDGYAPIIDAAVLRMVAATGLRPVLVCHSMGGLAARAWWRDPLRRGDVARIVTIGSPHGGTWLARFSRRANGRQMQLRGDWLMQLHADESRRPLPPMTCWYSNCDNVVFPAATATLPQADNRFVPGQPHVGLAFHPQVLQETLQILAVPPSR